MKRVRSAVWILLILSLTVIFSAFLVHDTTKSLLHQLDTIQITCEQYDFEQAAAQIEQMNNYYQKREHWLALFIKRDYLGSIAVSISGLSAYAKPENLQDLKSEIGKARTQLLMVDHLFFSLL